MAELKVRALRLLARREYSRQELARRLLAKPAPSFAPNSTKPARPSIDDFTNFHLGPSAVIDEDAADDMAEQPPSAAEVNALLDELERRHMLSDTRYAEARTRLRATRYGDSRLRQELAQKGIDPETIDATLAAQPDEAARCFAVWQKKFGQLPHDANERLKQTRYLANRGFALRVIGQVLRGAINDPTDNPATDECNDH